MTAWTAIRGVSGGLDEDDPRQLDSGKSATSAANGQQAVSNTGEKHLT